jgi:hypothetical protein
VGDRRQALADFVEAENLVAQEMVKDDALPLAIEKLKGCLDLATAEVRHSGIRIASHAKNPFSNLRRNRDRRVCSHLNLAGASEKARGGRYWSTQRQQEFRRKSAPESFIAGRLGRSREATKLISHS